MYWIAEFKYIEWAKKFSKFKEKMRSFVTKIFEKGMVIA